MSASSMHTLLDKFAQQNVGRLLEKHLPDWLSRRAWADQVTNVSLPFFSRNFPNKFPLVVNDDTCIIQRGPWDNNMGDLGSRNNQVTKYFVRDEILNGAKLIDVQDIDWSDYTTDNIGLSNGSLGSGYYYPSGFFGCPEAIFESVLALQMNADFTSLFNMGIVILYNESGGYFTLQGMGNTDYDLRGFVVNLLVHHTTINTISEGKMNKFEELAFSDIANFLCNNLDYVDDLETIYVQINLKLDKLRRWADRNEEIRKEIEESRVSASNDNQPMIMCV